MRKNGYKILDNYVEKMKEKKHGSNYGFWILYLSEEYYYKSGTEYECYMKLFCEEIAKLLGIPTVSYDLALWKKQTGVISKNMNPKNLKEITIYEIILEHYENVIMKNPKLFSDEIFLENAYNLEDIWWALEYHYRFDKNKEKIIKKLMNQIIESFLLQILTFNSDLNYENLIILEDEIPSLAPNFDYGRGGLVNLQLPINNYFLPVIPFNMKERKNAIGIIQDYINLSDLSYIEKFEKYTNLLNKESLNLLLENIEKKTHYPIPEHVKDYLSSNFLEQISMIHEIFQNNTQKK